LGAGRVSTEGLLAQHVETFAYSEERRSNVLSRRSADIDGVEWGRLHHGLGVDVGLGSQRVGSGMGGFCVLVANCYYYCVVYSGVLLQVDFAHSTGPDEAYPQWWLDHLSVPPVLTIGASAGDAKTQVLMNVLPTRWTV
jgi:hypothetical protein